MSTLAMNEDSNTDYLSAKTMLLTARQTTYQLEHEKLNLFSQERKVCESRSPRKWKTRKINKRNTKNAVEIIYLLFFGQWQNNLCIQLKPEYFNSL